MTRLPRLQQPLFSKEHGSLYNKALEDKLLSKLVMAYDSIWSLLYKPHDIAALDVKTNAEANLNNLGNIIVHVLGEEVFENTKQLSFPEEILNTELK